jgi:hypothetical protein
VGPAFFWIALAPREFWKRWEALLIAIAIVVYALPYWLSMAHPTYHYPILLPLSALGAVAWVNRKPNQNLTRGWIALASLFVVEAEWLWQLFNASH